MIGKSKLRFNAGFRVTKQNAAYMLFFLLFYWLLVACIYMGVLCFWILYAIVYGIYWCIKKILKLGKNANN